MHFEFYRHLLLSLSIWSNLSYIYLCQRNWEAALCYAEKILEADNKLSPAGYKFLGQLYSAEAYMNLDRINDALVLLNPKKVTDLADLSFTEPIQTNGNNENNAQESGEQQALGKAIFVINLAVAHILREEIDKAEDILEKIASHAPKEIRYKVLSLRLYLSLSKGNVEKAKELASRYFENEMSVGIQ